MPGVAHVINYDLPETPETYVHRIGRTARAGAEGESISFCSSEEKAYLKRIEKLIRRGMRVQPLPRGGKDESSLVERAPAPRSAPRRSDSATGETSPPKRKPRRPAASSGGSDRPGSAAPGAKRRGSFRRRKTAKSSRV